jgi:hypothetical protein
MPILPANQSQLIDVPIFNAIVPREGPKALAITAPFTAQNTSFDINLLLTQSQQFMSQVQAVFVDNSANADQVTISTQVLGQTLRIPPGSQAYLPLPVAKNDVLTVATAGEVNVQFIFLNVPVPAAVWAVA